MSGAEKRKRKAEKVKDVAKQEGCFLKFLRPETQDDRCLTVKCYDYEAEPGPSGSGSSGLNETFPSTSTLSDDAVTVESVVTDADAEKSAPVQREVHADAEPVEHLSDSDDDSDLESQHGIMIATPTL